MKFCLLASGSKGNALWIESEGRAILIDNGLSGKELKKRLMASDLDINALKAIFISHEHCDHIRGISPIARPLNLPVYATSGTIKGCPENIQKLSLKEIDNSTVVNVGFFKVTAFSVSHDANDPVGFVVENSCGLLGVVTDLGQATSLVRKRLSNLSALILEFNHDPILLHNGPYPWPLKQRVKSRTGHLANQEAADLLVSVEGPDLRKVILAHLSAVNNVPKLALEMARQALEHRPDLIIKVANQDIPSKVFKL